MSQYLIDCATAASNTATRVAWLEKRVEALEEAVRQQRAPKKKRSKGAKR